MEHITLDGLKREGHIPLAFHRDPESQPFMPNVSGPLPTPSGKIEFYSEALAARAWTLCQSSSLISNRAGAKLQISIRSSF